MPLTVELGGNNNGLFDVSDNSYESDGEEKNDNLKAPADSLIKPNELGTM